MSRRRPHKMTSLSINPMAVVTPATIFPALRTEQFHICKNEQVRLSSLKLRLAWLKSSPL